MAYIFVHGLGQNASSWQKTIEYIDMDTQQVVSPDLFSLLEGSKVDYHNLYHLFSIIVKVSMAQFSFAAFP